MTLSQVRLGKRFKRGAVTGAPRRSPRLRAPLECGGTCNAFCAVATSATRLIPASAVLSSCQRISGARSATPNTPEPMSGASSSRRKRQRQARGERPYGGWGGIRTPGEPKPTPVFKTGALNHSATHPCLCVNYLAEPDLERNEKLSTNCPQTSPITGPIMGRAVSSLFSSSPPRWRRPRRRRTS